MAKCTETCPKCGSVATTDGGANYWPCGSHDRRGFFYQSDLCEARTELAAANAEIERLRSLLAEAHYAVGNWGSYASEYFQEKWGWRQDVEKFAPFAKYYPKDYPHA